MTRLGRVTSFLLAPLLLGPGGCGDPGGGSGARVRIDTVAGVVRVSNEGTGRWGPDAAWRLGEPALRLGTVEGAGPEAFGEIVAVAVGSDGSVYVADGQALEIRGFDAGGRHLFTAGGEGEGPGELRALDGLVVEAGGTIAARDPRLARASRFSAAGAFLTSFRLDRPYLIFSDGTTWWGDREGRLFDRVLLPSGPGEPGRLAVFRYGPDGGGPDTVAVVESPGTTVLATRDGRPVASLPVPFSPRPFAAVGPEGRVGWGTGGEYRIGVAGVSGDTLRWFGRAVEPEPVRPAEREAAVADLRERVEELVGDARIGEVEVPSHRPAASRLAVDAAGRWWVGRWRGERSPDDPTAHLPAGYDVFDPEGRFLGTVETPPILITWIGEDRVAGIETDELGVDRAVVLPILRP